MERLEPGLVLKAESFHYAAKEENETKKSFAIHCMKIAFEFTKFRDHER